MNTHKHFLRELSKFASGLIVADFLIGLWLLMAVPLPVTLFSILWPASTIMAWMVFDVLLFLILIHYGWHADIHTPSVTQKKFFLLIGIITGLVALVHLLRLVFGISLEIGGWQAPYWMSWIATIVAACISYTSFRFGNK
jgi:hypothetical protein